MKKAWLQIFLIIIFWMGLPRTLHAHFGMIIPSTDMVENQREAELSLNIMFAHPFEGVSMDMEKPIHFGFYRDGEKEELTSTLKPYRLKLYADKQPVQAWQAGYKVQRPGTHIFYVEPQPYWEPVEDSYIVHYTKVIVDAYGKEEGWAQELGLKTEIVPLTRPFGLYAGNIFQGVVKVDGKPVPYCNVEVEYYNRDGRYITPKAPLVTQVVRCDANGVFSYVMPVAGWWGFAALNTDERTIPYEDEEKPVEIGAVLWVRAYDFYSKW